MPAWYVPIEEEGIVILIDNEVVVLEDGMLDKLIAGIQIEADGWFVVLHNMQVEDLACWPLQLEKLYCPIQKLCTQP